MLNIQSMLQARSLAFSFIVTRLMSLTVISLTLMSFFASAPAMASSWSEELYDEKNDIRVFTRKVKGSDMMAFRAITHIESTLTAPIALLQDVERAHKWVFSCQAMALIEKISETDALYYMVTDMPWPVSNRDSISATHISQDAETKVVRVDISARNDVFPENNDHVRIREMDGFWQMTPQGNGVIEVVYEAHADPGGGLPSWLVNSFLVDAPLETLRGFRKLITEKRYQTASMSFIEN